jgi:hypothetical protein
MPAEELAPPLVTELRREVRRSDDVSEENCQQPPFRGGRFAAHGLSVVYGGRPMQRSKQPRQGRSSSSHTQFSELEAIGGDPDLSRSASACSP